MNAAFEQELPQAGRAEIVEQAMRHTKLILVRDLDQAIEAVNDLAAEHVLLLVPDPEAVLPKVRNAGAVFLGHWTAVPYGDYGVASNHVLPTAGTARFSSGLRAADYVTVSSVIQMSQEAARRFTPGTSAIARAEGLVGHAKAMDARAEEAGDMSALADPRTGLRDVEPYVSPQLDVAARLNTNECPHPLPDGFFDELAEAVRDLPLHRYPDAQMTRLREELSAAAGHPAEGIWAANGSNEILTQLLQAYGGPGRVAVTFEPTYLLHARLCWLTQTEHRMLSLPANFVLGEPQVAAALDLAPDVVFVCSPNNPTGNAQPLSAIVALAEALPRSLVIVDEAYVEFSPAASARRSCPSTRTS